MIRSYRMSTPEETYSGRYVIILFEDDTPRGSAAAKTSQEADHITSRWLAGVACRTIKGVVCDRAI